MHTVDKDDIGAFGALLCSNAVGQTGVWNAILCLPTLASSMTVFATLTELGVTRQGTIASMAFPAGVTIYGAFTNFTLTTGSVRAYNSRNVVANP